MRSTELSRRKSGQRRIWRSAVRATLCSAVLTAGAFLGQAAFAQVTFKPFALPGVTLKSTGDVKVRQTLSIAGMDIETSSEQSNVAVSTYGPKAADGSVTAKMKMESIKVDIALPGFNVGFDSANPDAGGDAGPLAPIIDMLKAVIATEWEAKFGKDGRVSEVKVLGNAGSSLNAEARKVYDEKMKPEALRDQVNDEINKLPKGPVKAGDVWEYTNKMNLESGQSLSFQEEHTFKGEEQLAGKKVYRVETKAKAVTFAIDAAAGAPFAVKSSDLKVADSSGHYLFDPQAGAVVASGGKTRVQGDMVFVIGGMELPGKLDLTIEATSKTE